MSAEQSTRPCRYRHRSWRTACGKPQSDAVHYTPDGWLRPPYGEYSGRVRHPFDASDRWDRWAGEPDRDAFAAGWEAACEAAGRTSGGLDVERLLAVVKAAYLFVRYRAGEVRIYDEYWYDLTDTLREIPLSIYGDATPESAAEYARLTGGQDELG